MIKKIAFFGAVTLLISSIMSCEEDFTDVGSTIIENSKFSTKEIVLDVKITQKNIDAVQSGNVGISELGEYLFGVYQKKNAQTVEAGIVSQLTVPSLKITSKLKDGEKLSEKHLDEVILKIPVKATFKNKTKEQITTAEGKTKTVAVPNFKIDSLLGNTNAAFSVDVFRNGSYLSRLNPLDPKKANKYLSDKTYLKEGAKLNLSSSIKFNTLATDTVFIFNRTLSNGTVYKDTLKVANGKIKATPFITIRLNKSKLKTDIFDKYKDAQLSSQAAFNDYFKGIIIQVTKGTEGGAMIPLSLSSGALRPSLDFIHTSTIIDKDGKPVKDEKGKIKKIESVDSFYLGGIKNSTYTMSGTAINTTNNIFLQGTAGSNAVVKILEGDSNNNGITDFEELRKKKIIINGASLIFDVNTDIKDSIHTPRRLFLFKNEKNKLGNKVPLHLADMFFSGEEKFNGRLQLKDKKPDHYSFNIRKHIANVIKGTTPNSELILRVFNTTDLPTKKDISIKNYNWNPRSVSVLSNSTKNGTVRGVKLKIFYTEEK